MASEGAIMNAKLTVIVNESPDDGGYLIYVGGHFDGNVVDVVTTSRAKNFAELKQDVGERVKSAIERTYTRS